MRSRTKRSNKRSRTRKKTIRLGSIVLASVLLGTLGYCLYRLFTPRHTPPHLFPIYETYSSEGVQTKVEDIDRYIYDALFALNVAPRDVTFQTVELKRHQDEVWTFSELEIRLPTQISHSTVKQLFMTRLSERIPQKCLRFVSGTQQKLVLDVHVNGWQTHRLTFFKRRAKGPAAPPPSSLPKVAIIIDDLGYDKKLASKFIFLDGIISFSVLPHSPFQKSIANTIHRSGRDLLLHLPMEPMEYPIVDPGAGALLSSMAPDDLLDQLRNDLEAVPFAVGVNNHMGSRLTQDRARMRQIFTILKRRNLFFVDSLTSPRSCCKETALQLDLKFAQRNVFLDHVQEPNAIRFQIKRLISVARKKGKAIGIGHPYPTTLEVLREELPNIKKRVGLVKISELVG